MGGDEDAADTVSIGPLSSAQTIGDALLQVFARPCGDKSDGDGETAAQADARMQMLRDGKVHGATGDGHAEGSEGSEPWEDLPTELQTDGIKSVPPVGGSGTDHREEVRSLLGAEATVRSAAELLRQAAASLDSDGDLAVQGLGRLARAGWKRQRDDEGSTGGGGDKQAEEKTELLLLPELAPIFSTAWRLDRQEDNGRREEQKGLPQSLLPLCKQELALATAGKGGRAGLPADGAMRAPELGLCGQAVKVIDIDETDGTVLVRTAPHVAAYDYLAYQRCPEYEPGLMQIEHALSSTMRALGGHTELEQKTKQMRWGVVATQPQGQLPPDSVTNSGPKESSEEVVVEMEIVSGLEVPPLSEHGPLWQGVHIKRTRANTPEPPEEERGNR